MPRSSPTQAGKQTERRGEKKGSAFMGIDWAGTASGPQSKSLRDLIKRRENTSGK